MSILQKIEDIEAEVRYTRSQAAALTLKDESDPEEQGHKSPSWHVEGKAGEAAPRAYHTQVQRRPRGGGCVFNLHFFVLIWKASMSRRRVTLELASLVSSTHACLFVPNLQGSLPLASPRFSQTLPEYTPRLLHTNSRR